MTEKRLFRLLKDLKHDDPSKRRLAAEGLAFADERAVYPLINALRDDSPGVQDAAIQSLISIGGDVTAYMVVPQLRNESPFIRNAAIVILRALDRVSIPFLYDLLKDKDEDVRKFSLDLLGEIKDGVSYERILPLLKDINPNVRASAAKVLGILGNEESVSSLVEALRDEEWVAFSAIEALGRIGSHTAMDALSEILRSGSRALRIAVIESISMIGTGVAVDILQRHLKRAVGMERDMTIKGLLRFDCLPEVDGVAESILKLFIEGEWEDRFLYLRGLVKLHYHEAIPVVIDIAGSIDPSMPDADDILLEIKEILKGFGCSDSLIDIIKDPNFRFRGKVIAIDLLGDLRCKRAVPYLIELLKTDLRDVKRASLRAIESIDVEQGRQVFIEAVNDYDSHIRRTAVKALGKIRAKEAFEPIMQLLEGEPYNDVLDEAVRALLRIDREMFLSRLGNLKGYLIDTINSIIGDEL